MIVWITALTDKYQDIIVSSLVKEGFTVGPASTGNDIAWQGTACALIVLEVNHRTLTEINQVYDVVLKILTDNKIFYHSIIAGNIINSIWKVGKCQLPVKTIKPSCSHLKLIKSPEDDQNPV